jgi:hypothetical protein
VSLDKSRKRTSGENVAAQQEPATEGGVPVTSKRGLPRKRARVEHENISPPRNRPRRSKKDTSVSKPRKAAPSRVRKTYRNRQKVGRSSLGRTVNRDVDYDEIPPSIAAPNSPTAKARALPPNKSSDDISSSRAWQVKGTEGRTILHGPPVVAPWPADEKKQEKGEPNQTGTCLVQVPPTEVVDDDDPIQSFSSSPSELSSFAINAVRVFDDLHPTGISCLNCTAYTPSPGILQCRRRRWLSIPSWFSHKIS